FKTFMDDTSKVWLEQSWQGKLAAGFTNSGGLSGDKLAVLQQIQLFAMQHGMLWAGMPLMPTGTQPEDLNRMGSYMGLMAQSDSAPVDVTPPVGDLRTAEWFGQHIAKTVQRIIN
ncbi:MAG TPA: flavodoxin family protein, partial [Agitococcus sp.]|nr:flavodoxin family protein [Agitococcus sp.]